MALRIPRFSNDATLRAASENTPPLQQGASGEAVAILQQALVDLGFPMPKSTGGGLDLPDGIWGSETTATVKAFQSANGMQVDGVVGRETLSRLENLIVAAGEFELARYRVEIGRTEAKA